MHAKLLVLPLGLCLLLSGCSLQDVNSVSIIDYERRDRVVAVMLKTAGNVVLSAMLGVFVAGRIYLQSAAASSSGTRRGW